MDKDPDILDSDLMCQCGGCVFHIRFQDGDTIAVCPDCGESCIID